MSVGNSAIADLHYRLHVRRIGRFVDVQVARDVSRAWGGSSTGRKPREEINTAAGRWVAMVPLLSGPECLSKQIQIQASLEAWKWRGRVP